MTAQTMEFKTELKQLMDIIIHSLYTHRDVFLRELISNASDAIDKIRFDALTDSTLTAGDEDYRIELIPDAEAKTLTLRDNGIGMDADAVVENLGTIARSGTKAFLEQLKEAKAEERPELIGQFGVGFYSAFMVADTVTVLTKAPGKEAVRWVSTGEGEFSVEPAERAGRGTDVVLHLKEDATEFLDGWRLRQTVKKFSDFVAHPIVLITPKKEEPAEGETQEGDKDEEGAEAKDEAGDGMTRETLNQRQAIWLRPKSEIEAEEYAAFYKHISNDFQDPAKTIHYSAEGMIEFKALLFLPQDKPFDFFMAEPKSRLQLYVKRVFVTDDCEALLPAYLRFVKGVVDCADLPLNVSREMLQKNPLLDKIRKNLVTKVLGTLKEMMEKDRDAYERFWEAFGPVLKEGINQDFANKEAIADLCLFESTRTDEATKYVSLAQYAEVMPEDQPAIYYLVGESKAVLERSPYLEAFREKGYEVLFMTDPMDEWLGQAVGTYKEKPFQAVDKGEAAPDESAKAEVEKKTEAYKDLLALLADKLEGVKEVRLSTRLRESAACLVVDDGAMGAHVERLLKRMGQEQPPSERILELNPDHATVQGMQALFEKDREDARLAVYGQLLLDEATIAEGSKVADPTAMAKRINDLIAKDLSSEA